MCSAEHSLIGMTGRLHTLCGSRVRPWRVAWVQDCMVWTESRSCSWLNSYARAMPSTRELPSSSHGLWPPGISMVHAGLPEQVMSAHGWDDPTRSGQLAADVEEMVVRLVDGVHRNPLQRSFARFRVVVDDATHPVAGTQPVKHVGEHLRRVGELAGDVLGFLLGIAVVVDSLVSAHGRAVRPISPAGGEDPLALDEQHVSQVTAVLQGRPYAGLPSSPQIDDGMAPQDCHDLGDPFPDHPPGH
jgi:hypothetical protein